MPGTRARQALKGDAGGGWDGMLWGPSRAAPAGCWVAGAHHSQAAAPKAGLGRSSSPGAPHKPRDVSGTARGSSCFEHGESNRALAGTELQPRD